ncbi:hypothetical protein B0T14DRAFT_120583 [Immersiella caudata]|uniref:Uncharacterized protein n=1 Tax=Immersiella caudata TaxID=314043 RepID=A0AA39X434_9PEZI|nr:hypothetical protein B0T14DRAFT_120583 [Immersiella caudata]
MQSYRMHDRRHCRFILGLFILNGSLPREEMILLCGEKPAYDGDKVCAATAELLSDHVVANHATCHIKLGRRTIISAERKSGECQRTVRGDLASASFKTLERPNDLVPRQSRRLFAQIFHPYCPLEGLDLSHLLTDDGG